MKAIIITIGDEILMGQILDTNSQYIARSLTDMGVEITEILSIPDKRDEIYETVEYAMSEADLIIVTGGLGPTKDDVTKKVLAEYFVENERGSIRSARRNVEEERIDYERRKSLPGFIAG